MIASLIEKEEKQVYVVSARVGKTVSPPTGFAGNYSQLLETGRRLVPGVSHYENNDYIHLKHA